MTERSRPFQTSLSFSGTASFEQGSRSLKRRRTSQPPVLGSSRPNDTAQSLPSTSREMAPIVTALDPTDTDHKATFLHPPFSVFPNSHKYPQGLTYGVMAQNPDWFLDANDFTSPTNTNPLAIHYPAQLEPPRGWCPAKKRDLKDKGNDGWPEGEEPRLRCTFCRRTYAGVNAKSMWRRHVYEKHKIAMANRRDNANAERSRRRGSASVFFSFFVFSHSMLKYPLQSLKEATTRRTRETRSGFRIQARKQTLPRRTKSQTILSWSPTVYQNLSPHTLKRRVRVGLLTNLHLLFPRVSLRLSPRIHSVLNPAVR